MYGWVIYLSYSPTRRLVFWGKITHFSFLYPSQCQTWNRCWTLSRSELNSQFCGGEVHTEGAARSSPTTPQYPSEPDHCLPAAFFSASPPVKVGYLAHAMQTLHNYNPTPGRQLRTQGKPCPVAMTSLNEITGQGRPRAYSSSLVPRADIRAWTVLAHSVELHLQPHV